MPLKLPTEYKAKRVVGDDGDEWFIPASDIKGHYERLWFNLPPTLHHELEILFQSHQFPYKTVASVLRHALSRHLSFLRSINEPPNTVSGQVEIANLIVRESEKLIEYDNLFKLVSDNVFSGNTDNELVLDMLQRLENTLEAMPEGTWKSKYTSEFQKRFGHLV